MDRKMKRVILNLHANGHSASDIAKKIDADNRKERKDYILTTMTIEDVLREMGAADPTRRIPQKPMVQSDMPKRFINIEESKRQRQKHSIRTHNPTETQREFHQIACGFAKNGQKLLKSRNRHELERIIVEHLERGFEQIGNISSDFDYGGDIFIAIVRKGI
ncbi:hypothetical protein ACFQO8_03730 [Exiguobacterium aestuarii]|uniref:Uncharacterized protein n=1 Tax=Exiguobacterium aestuarii TaxID=273527 RepID=A0ABW2PLN1_9BACL|nr:MULTISPECIES: hypothetical protein [Exiguobacterium]MCT4786605.1 hypothetical protein [Exiguobacterium aestuarii]